VEESVLIASLALEGPGSYPGVRDISVTQLSMHTGILL
jgi:hypothetical protein